MYLCSPSEYNANSGKLTERHQYSLNNHCNKIPDSLIIGFEKCGTAALKTFLNIHPQIYAPEEPNDIIWNSATNISTEEYQAEKNCTPEGMLKVEKMAVRGMPERVYQTNKDMKLIAIVREPTQRAVSHFVQRLFFGEVEEGTFPLMVEDLLKSGRPEKSILFNQGMYSTKLKTWLEYFPKDQIHIVDGDNFVKNPTEELRAIESFLGLRPYITSEHFIFNEEKGFNCIRGPDEDLCMNRRKGMPHPFVQPSVLEGLQDFFKPHNEEFFRMFDKRYAWGNNQLQQSWY